MLELQEYIEEQVDNKNKLLKEEFAAFTAAERVNVVRLVGELEAYANILTYLRDKYFKEK